MRYTLPITFTLLLVAASALAQSSATAVAMAHTPVYVVPEASRTPLRTASQGTIFTVVAEEGEWTKVQFKDPQWGVRVGYVETRLLRFSRPELAPMDLSVTAPGAPPATVAPVSAAAPATPSLRPWEVPEPRSAWPTSYVVGRGGVTFGTRTAPLAGFEIGGLVAPMLQVYGAFDWHRDISPRYIGDVAELLTEMLDADVEVRTPAYVFMGGVKVIAPRGTIRPYGLGGFGVGRTDAVFEIDGVDVIDIAQELDLVDEEDVRFTKPVFEVGGGIAIATNGFHADISYRFRKALDVGEPVNVSGIYAGVGVGF